MARRPKADAAAGAGAPAPWPADKVERRPIEALIPYARNARTHSDAQIALLAGAITHWGWTTPALVDEAGVLIAGHGRVLAARKLGLKEVPVMVAAGWTEAQKQAYRLADNRIPLSAGWDPELLRLEITELSGGGADLSVLGFSARELDNALKASDLDGASQLGDELTFQVVVDCADEADQAECVDQLRAAGKTCRPLTL